MVECLLAGPVLTLLIFGAIQISLLWASQGAIDTAAHFAAREFAQAARADSRKARTAGLARAADLCRLRPGGRLASATLTSLDFTREGSGGTAGPPAAGEAYRVRLKHWVELPVPMANRVLYALAPVEKARLGGRYYLVLHATRFATVE